MSVLKFSGLGAKNVFLSPCTWPAPDIQCFPEVQTSSILDILAWLLGSY